MYLTLASWPNKFPSDKRLDWEQPDDSGGTSSICVRHFVLCEIPIIALDDFISSPLGCGFGLCQMSVLVWITRRLVAREASNKHVWAL